MKRDACVDFFLVEDKHLAIHGRLLNWRNWCYSGGGGYTCSPMFRLYRPTDVEDREDVTRNSIPLDKLDGAAIQVAVQKLPEANRGSMNWYYLRPSNPRRAAMKLGVSEEGLQLLVRSGRQMLVNRGC